MTAGLIRVFRGVNLLHLLHLLGLLGSLYLLSGGLGRLDLLDHRQNTGCLGGSLHNGGSSQWCRLN